SVAVGYGSRGAEYRGAVGGMGCDRQEKHAGERESHRELSCGSANTIRVEPPRGAGRSGQKTWWMVPTTEPQPEGVAKYWRPATEYVTAEPRWPAPVWKLHRRLPLLASRAKKLPSGSPLKIRPPAVAS